MNYIFEVCRRLLLHTFQRNITFSFPFSLKYCLVHFRLPFPFISLSLFFLLPCFFSFVFCIFLYLSFALLFFLSTFLFSLFSFFHFLFLICSFLYSLSIFLVYFNTVFPFSSFLPSTTFFFF